MAFIGKKTALALKLQADSSTPAAISTPADLLVCYDLRPGTNEFTLANPETTGTVDSPGDFVTGRERSVSFNLIIRGPGGVAPPSADAWVFGRVLRMMRFTETSQTAVALASGALSGGTTTSAILPVGASASDDAYNGLCASLDGQAGTGLKKVSMIRDYVGSTRTATFMETFGANLSGNIVIPPYLGYLYSDTAPELFASVRWWADKKRYDMVNAVVTSAQFNFPTNNNSDTAFTYISVTLTGDIAAVPDTDETAPVVGQGGNPPLLRDADYWIAAKAFCGSGATVDFNIQTARPPCPGTASGGEAHQIIDMKRMASFNINEVLNATADVNALADAQGYHSAWIQYGQGGTGKCVSFGIPDARIGYSEAEIGQFVTRQVPLKIDHVGKSMSIQFPYF